MLVTMSSHMGKKRVDICYDSHSFQISDWLYYEGCLATVYGEKSVASTS